MVCIILTSLTALLTLQLLVGSTVVATDIENDIVATVTNRYFDSELEDEAVASGDCDDIKALCVAKQEKFINALKAPNDGHKEAFCCKLKKREIAINCLVKYGPKKEIEKV